MRTAINRFAVVAAIGAAFGSAGAAASTAPTPQTLLYKALLASSLSDVQLPGGFGSSTTAAAAVSSSARRHHAAGEVEISIDYGDALIDYVVFPSRQDALDDWAGGNIAQRPGVKSQLAANGFPVPGLIVSGSAGGNDALGVSLTNGFTTLAFVDGNVSVAVTTKSTSSAVSGNLPDTRALGKLARGHLRRVEKHLTG